MAILVITVSTLLHSIDSITGFIRWVLGTGEYCVLRHMRRAVGLSYGSPEFKAITEPYWTRGKGTTCAVTANWALMQCGIPVQYLNRDSNWVPGNHVPPLLDYAKSKGAFIANIHPSDLVATDYFYIQGESLSDWHVGFVEANHWPEYLITLDGGQVDSRGEQAIARVRRNFTGELIGPRPRALKFCIRTKKLF